MSVIIRLQNLPWSANALDIRQFFQGLSIPEGGVHIVGGEQGDAFIAFSTDEDARQAMMHNGGKLKEVQVSLLLSSRSEMQKVIDTARQKVLGMQAASATPAAPAAPIAPVMPAVQPVQQPAIPTITPAIPNITAPQLAQQMGLPMQAQLPVQQRLLGMLGMGMAAQLNNLQQNSMPLATAAAHSNNPLMHPHLTMQQQQQHQHHQQTMLPHHQAPNPMMQAQLNQMRPNLPMNNQNQLHQQQQQQQMHHQQQQQHQVNERPGRDGRPDRRRSRSRSRDRKRSRDRRDRGGGSSRRRRSRSRSRDRDKNRRRDRSKSRERSRDHNRDSRDRRKDDRKSSRDEKPARGKDDANNVSKNSQQGPTPWVSPSANAPAGPTMSRFSPYQPNNNSQQGDGPVWGQQKQPFNSPPAQQPPHNNSQSNGSGPQQPPRRAPQQNTCVQVSNMPQSVVYRDLREFFQQLHVLNIKLITDEKGHKQGRALIKFGSTECKLKAMTMTGSMYNGTHRIEVKHCTEEEYDRTLDSFTPSQEPAVVAINNIPPYANEMDVKRVFHGARIFNVVLMHPGDKTGIPSGFVQFSTMSEKNRAIAASGKLKIDNQEIFVSDSSFEEIFKAQKALRNSSSSSSINSESPVKMKEDLPAVGVSPVLSECVLLKGLPLTANNREILDFFSDVGLIPLHIYIMQDDKGAPAGDAFCEFRNPAEGVRAVAKNKSTLGTKEVTVRPVLRQEMEMALGMAKNPNQMMPRNGQDQMRHSMRPNFMNRPQFDPRNPQMFPMRGPFPRGPFPPHMMGNRPRPPFMNGPPQEPNIEFGKPGCVVEVTNVPYQADIDEILNFFSDFELTRQDVIRRFNDMGKPTGDLRIAFHSPQDAQRALALKFKKMRDRQLYMNLLQT